MGSCRARGRGLCRPPVPRPRAGPGARGQQKARWAPVPTSVARSEAPCAAAPAARANVTPLALARGSQTLPGILGLSLSHTDPVLPCVGRVILPWSLGLHVSGREGQGGFFNEGFFSLS